MSTRFTIGKFPVRNDDDAVLVKPFDSNRGQEYLWEAADVTVDPSEWSVQIVPAIIDWVSADIQVDESAWRAVITADMSSDISTDVDVDPDLSLIVYLEIEIETEVELEGRIVSTLDMSTSIETEIEVDPFLRMSAAMSMVVGGVECGVNQNSFAPGHEIGSGDWMTLAWVGGQLAVTNLGPSHKEVRFFEIDKQKLTATLVQTLHWPTSSLQIERSGSGLILGNGGSYFGSLLVQSPLQLTELVQDGTGQWVASQTWAPEQPDLPGVAKFQNFQASGDYLIAIVGLARAPGSLEWTASIYKRVAGSWVLQSSYIVDNSSLTDLDDWIILDATIFENTASFIVAGRWSPWADDRALEVTLIRDPILDSWAVENTEIVLNNSIYIEPHNKIWLSDSAFIQYRYEDLPAEWVTRLWQKDGSQFKTEKHWTDFIPIVQVKPNMLFGYEYNQYGPVYFPSIQVLQRTATGWALRDKLTNPSTSYPYAAASSPDGTVVAWSGYKGGSNPEEAYDIIYLTRVGEYGHLLPYGICLNADLTTTDTIEMLVEILTSIDLNAALNLRANLSTDITTSATINAELDVRTFVDLSTNIQTNITMNPILDLIETELLEDAQAWAQYGLTGNLKLWKPPTTLRLDDQQAWAQYGLTGRVKLAEPCVCADPVAAILATNPTHFWYAGVNHYAGVDLILDRFGDLVTNDSTAVKTFKAIVGGEEITFNGTTPAARWEDGRIVPHITAAGISAGSTTFSSSVADHSIVAVMKFVTTYGNPLMQDSTTGQSWTNFSASVIGISINGLFRTQTVQDGDWTVFYGREGSARWWQAIGSGNDAVHGPVGGAGALPLGSMDFVRPLQELVAIIVYDHGERVGELLDEGLNDLIEDLKNYDPDECHCDEPEPPDPDPGERELSAHDFSFTKAGLYRTGGTQARTLTQKDFTWQKGGLAPAFDSQTRTLAQRDFSWTKQTMDSFTHPFVRVQGDTTRTINGKGNTAQILMARGPHPSTNPPEPLAQCALFIIHSHFPIGFLHEGSGVTILQQLLSTVGASGFVYIGLVTKLFSNPSSFELIVEALSDSETVVSCRYIAFNHSAAGGTVMPTTTSVLSSVQTGFNAVIQSGHNTAGWYPLNVAGVISESAGKFASPFNVNYPNTQGWISDGTYHGPFHGMATCHAFGQNGGWTWTLSGLSGYEFVTFNVQIRCTAPFIED